MKKEFRTGLLKYGEPLQDGRSEAILPTLYFRGEPGVRLRLFFNTLYGRRFLTLSCYFSLLDKHRILARTVNKIERDFPHRRGDTDCR